MSCTSLDTCRAELLFLPSPDSQPPQKLSSTSVDVSRSPESLRWFRSAESDQKSCATLESASQSPRCPGSVGSALSSSPCQSGIA